MSGYRVVANVISRRRSKRRQGLGHWRQLVCGRCPGRSHRTDANCHYPGDTVRRRMQTDGMQGRARVYGSMMDCVRQTVAKREATEVSSAGSASIVYARCLARHPIPAYEWFKYVLTGAR